MKIKLGAEVAPEDKTTQHSHNGIIPTGSILICGQENRKKNLIGRQEEVFYCSPIRNVQTDDAKDVPNVRNKDDEQIDSKEEAQSNGYVTRPVKRFLRENQLQ